MGGACSVKQLCGQITGPNRQLGLQSDIQFDSGAMLFTVVNISSVAFRGSSSLEVAILGAQSYAPKLPDGQCNFKDAVVLDRMHIFPGWNFHTRTTVLQGGYRFWRLCMRPVDPVDTVMQWIDGEIIVYQQAPY